MKRRTDISAIVVGHEEGETALVSWRSAAAACDRARERGLSMELIVVLDRPDGATLNCFSGAETRGTRLVLADHGDLGRARNLGVAEAQGRFVAFLDGDDLWESGWLWRAFECATEGNARVIWHPALSVYFGEGPYWVREHEDQDSPGFNLDYLVATNFWTALAFAARDAFSSVPYEPNDLEHGLGLEDWHWNCETIARGWIHRTVPGTVHFIRQRRDGLLAKTVDMGALVRPSSLFLRRPRSRASSARDSYGQGSS